jgi:hypothetical protein
MTLQEIVVAVNEDLDVKNFTYHHRPLHHRAAELS